MADVPFFLNPQDPNADSSNQLINFNYDYSYQQGDGTKSGSLWSDIANSVDSGVATVFDPLKNAWSSVESEASNLVQGVENVGSSIMDKIEQYAIFIFVGIIVLIVVLGKSGILKVNAII